MILKISDSNQELTVKELVELLKIEAKDVDIIGIMHACTFLMDEMKFVHKNYREKFYKTYIKGFILRIKEIKEDKNIYNDSVAVEELKNSLKQLKEQEVNQVKVKPINSNFLKIYQIISIYTTFVLNEPIHIVGTEFPGNLQVKMDNGKYLCPVKDKQKDNPLAVCGFCIAEQDPDT